MSGYEEQELTAIDAALDANPDATSNEVFQATRPYDERAIASVAASRALAGGGGSLPSWWTVDSTPGAESVDFAGFVSVTPSDVNLDALATITAPVGFLDNSGQYTFLDLIGENGARVWTFDASGDMWARGVENQGHSAIFMRSVDFSTYRMNLTSGSSAGAPFIQATAPDRTAFQVDKAGNTEVGGTLTVAAADGVGLLGAGPTAAPADAEVFAPGIWTLWMDTTNGAAKLMVKARQANGTVVTGSVNLS